MLLVSRHPCRVFGVTKRAKAGTVLSMISLPTSERMYKAVIESEKSFDGVFYVAVKTTRIFCRPTCPARKPLQKNVEFFASPGDALYAGYRPCKRCRPMDRVEQAPDWVREAQELIEQDPGRRLTNKELPPLGLQPERLRRYFKQHYGMTFQAYARGRRLGQAFSKLREGQHVIETAMDHGFDSTSGFREAFHKAFGDAPSRCHGKGVLLMRWIQTPLGAMVAAATDEALCLLEFSDRRMIALQLRTLASRFDSVPVPGNNAVLGLIESELAEYFAGTLREFKTPVAYPGTAFQVAVWRRLLEIPYGGVLSYGAMARDLGFPDAQRAVGKANGDNRIAIVIPCHRVIRADGTLCGYGGGLWRKQRLLELESGQTNFL